MILDQRAYTEMSVEGLGLTQIGFKSERMNEYVRLNNLDKGISNYKSMLRRSYYEIKRFLANLDLPIQLRLQIEKNQLIFYSQLPSGINLRSPRILIPVTLYISALQNQIFVNVKELMTHSECSRVEFGRGLITIYRNNPLLYKSLKSEQFRKKMILNLLMGLKCYFHYPEPFIFLASEILELYYKQLKNSKIEVIVAKIFKLIKKALPNEMRGFRNIHLCNYLGIESGVCSKQIRGVMIE